MLNFEEELKKFKPSLEVEDLEKAVYDENLTDMTDIIREIMEKSKQGRTMDFNESAVA